MGLWKDVSGNSRDGKAVRYDIDSFEFHHSPDVSAQSTLSWDDRNVFVASVPSHAECPESEGEIFVFPNHVVSFLISLALRC